MYLYPELVSNDEGSFETNKFVFILHKCIEIVIMSNMYYNNGLFPFCHFRMLFNKRLLSGSHSSQSNLSQQSVTSDPLGADDIFGPINSQHTKMAERRSNSSSDIQGMHVESHRKS